MSRQRVHGGDITSGCLGAQAPQPKPDLVAIRALRPRQRLAQFLLDRGRMEHVDGDVAFIGQGLPGMIDRLQRASKEELREG